MHVTKAHGQRQSFCLLGQLEKSQILMLLFLIIYSDVNIGSSLTLGEIDLVCFINARCST